MTRVTLTQQHIDDGRRAEACRLSRECNCPVSAAVAEAGFDNPRVRLNTFTAGQMWSMVGARSERRRYVLPPEASRFIEHFDNSAMYPVVEPFEFDVDEDDYTEVLYDEAPA